MFQIYLTQVPLCQAFGDGNEPQPNALHISSQPFLIAMATILIVICMEMCVLNDFLVWVKISWSHRDGLNERAMHDPLSCIPMRTVACAVIGCSSTSRNTK